MPLLHPEVADKAEETAEEMAGGVDVDWDARSSVEDVYKHTPNRRVVVQCSNKIY